MDNIGVYGPQDLSPRKKKIPESEFKEGPEGLKYYDIKVGGGPEATLGERVVVHYEARWRGITFMTSRCCPSPPPSPPFTS